LSYNEKSRPLGGFFYSAMLKLKRDAFSIVIKVIFNKTHVLTYR